MYNIKALIFIAYFSWTSTSYIINLIVVSNPKKDPAAFRR